MLFSLVLLCALAAATRASTAAADLTARLHAAAAKAHAVERALALDDDDASLAHSAVSASSILGRKRGGSDNASAAGLLCADGSSDAVDSDKDGHPDCVDACAHDPRKTRPGACGCGERDHDSDGDGHADCVDACPLDAAKQTHAGLCGCGAADSGCGCNVAPVDPASHSCSHVVGTVRATAHDGAAFDLFGRDGGLAARVVLPAGAIDMRADEHLVLQLADGALASGAVAADALVHGAALAISVAQDPASRAPARERAANGYALDRAATVCLAPASELVVRGLCLGFFDVKSAGFKCFEPTLTYDAASKLACARVPLLTTVQLVRASRFTTIEPYVSAVEPRVVPADGRVAVRISGGNFERGVLTRVLVGGQPLDVAQCEATPRALVCSAVPAGRGAHQSLELQFTSHAAQDMLFTVKLADAFDYAAPAISAVELVGERVHITGEHFGPAGALHKSAVLVDGEACVDARVEVADQLLSCTAPAAIVALQKRAAAAGPASAKHQQQHKHTVAVRMDEHDEHVVHSTPAHWIHSCRGEQFRCQDGTCAAPGHLCPACPSGWSACPLARPVLAAGRCVTLREHAAHAAADFDVTVDGSATYSFAIGREGHFSVQPKCGPDALKHCVSVALPAHEDGFASAVFNISVAHDYRGLARLAARSAEIEKAHDAYGYCFARWNCDASRWQCVDESLEIELAPSGLVAGDVPVHAGTNLYAIIRDNCPNDANPSQRDSDADGTGDACEASGETAQSCRSRATGNVKYIQKIRESTHSNVDPQPCPYANAKQMPVCNPNEQIFEKHASSWAGARRPLPLKAPFEASEKRTAPKKP
jgi:hypothetical protein